MSFRTYLKENEDIRKAVAHFTSQINGLRTDDLHANLTRFERAKATVKDAQTRMAITQITQVIRAEIRRREQH